MNDAVIINAELEIIDAMLDQEYKILQDKLVDVVNKFIIVPHDAMLCRKSIRTEFNDNISMQFEIGFWNTEESRVDFGSDLWCNFCTDKNKLQINYGTCGSYTSSDTYQVRRVLLIADLWRNIEVIESNLLEIANQAKGKYRELIDKRDCCHAELATIREEQFNSELKLIAESLCIGDKLSYDSSVSPRYRFFNDWMNVCSIVKICDKTIKVKEGEHGPVKQVPKDKVVRLIKDNKIHVVKAGE